MVKGYGKRPLWQWVLLYLVIGGAIYFLAYYFFFNKPGSYNYSVGGEVTPYNYSGN